MFQHVKQPQYFAIVPTIVKLHETYEDIMRLIYAVIVDG